MRASSVFYAVLVSIITVFVSSFLILTPVHGASCPSTGCVQGGGTLNVNVTPTTGSSPLQISYKVSLTGSSAIKTIVLNFGDGSSVNSVANGTHTYQSAGNYTGTVDVDAKDGTSYTQTFSVTVTGSIGANVFNATIPNPDNGTMNAYKYFLQKHNNTLAATSQVPLAVQTDAPSYSQGDTVIIRGTVKDVSNQTAVTLRVFNTLKNMVSIAQLIPASDGSFSTKVLATGPLWTKAGNYTIIAQYGPATNSTTSFQYGGGDGSSKISAPPTNSRFALQTSAGTFNIPYTIRGGTVQNMQLDGKSHVLTITINAPSDGSINVDIPRAFMDSKQQISIPTGPNSTSTTQVNQAELPDQPFTVQVGGQSAQVTEIKTPTTRTLGISFHKGDTTIDILGTVSVPEFGPIAALVLAIAIVSIIAVSAKTGLRLMPKY
ncbi:MAG: PEFG-CTERM sorting domain-containing protein [Thaumarchaeota archaeon]|nr:PEFG-CTERM sorting domain-containing protein [Nitrososphaerota archaeon]